MSADEYRSRIDRAIDAIHQRWPHTPSSGIVLGTGSGAIAESLRVETRIPYQEIPQFPRSTAVGHSGNLVCGWFADRPVLAMQGRFHLYEGYTRAETSLPIHVMHGLGVERLLISNAAGGVNPRFQVGDMMIIDSQIDLFFRHGRAIPPSAAESVSRLRFRGDAALDGRLAEAAFSVSRQQDFPLHRGVYLGFLGPSYETRAEYRWARRAGADAVGMSTIPEIVAASDLGIPTLAISIITNVAKPDVVPPGPVTSAHGVIAAAEQVGQRLRAIFEAAVSR